MKPRPFGNLLVFPEEWDELAGREGERKRERKGLSETPPPSQGSRADCSFPAGMGASCWGRLCLHRRRENRMAQG